MSGETVLTHGVIIENGGEKKYRQTARLKIVDAKHGIEDIRRVVLEEKRTMPEDPSWRKYFDQIPRYDESPALQAVQLNGARHPEGFDEWAKTNLYPQRQAGYTTVTVTLPLGHPSPHHIRTLPHLLH